MKNMSKILLVVLAVLVIAVGVSYSETARLGQNLPKAFNPSRVVAKTAAYTLVGADSQVEVTASSANITITLPAIADVTNAGTKSYKIIKKDATAYAIVVTPASGETIGFESTRYLLGDESYMVISASGGKNWSVDYESPYIVEDHKAGTYTTGIGSGGLYSTATASATLTASACGNIYTATTGTLTFKLPPTVANCKIKFINAVGGAGAMAINPDDADQIFGGCTLAASVVTIAGAAGDSITNTSGTAVKGDWVELTGSGVAATGWWITGCQGIWADTN